MKHSIDPARLKAFWGKYKFVALVLCAGLLLMLIPTGKQGAAAETPQTETEQTFDLEALERKIEAALGEISGVGKATVVLTLKSGAEDVLAQDVSEGASPQTETVVVSAGSGTEQAVRVKTIYPEFQGALVVCQGGGDASVKWEVLKAVSAITGLSSDQIQICQGK